MAVVQPIVAWHVANQIPPKLPRSELAAFTRIIDTALAGNDPVSGADSPRQRPLTWEERRNISPICDYIDCNSVEIINLGWSNTDRNTDQG